MMSDGAIVRSGRHFMLADSMAGQPVSVSWFDPDEWQRGGAVAIETSGRGTVLVVDHGDDRWVLRHYHRGGLVAHFVADHYLWLGLERTRAFREWRLLRQLRAAGLPVPNPVAAHVARAGIIYTADIITSYLPGTRKLSWYLAQGKVPAGVWQRVGRLVRDVHEHGVDHPDLTAHNLLVDDADRVFLVDFDNARVRAPGPWQRLGLERLERSLRKVALETGTDFDVAAWRQIEAAYFDSQRAP